MVFPTYNLLHLKHKLPSPLEKSIVERAMYYFSYIEPFYDYYPLIINQRKIVICYMYTID